MKRICLITVICLLLSCVTASAYGVKIDNLYTDCNMEFSNNTVYLSVEEVAEEMGKVSHWDEKTQTLFVGGIYLFPKKGEKITVYVDGEKKIQGEGFILDNKTYLPAHIVAAAFDLTASYDSEKGEVMLTSNILANKGEDIKEDKTYAIINKATGEALSVSDGNLTTEKYTKSETQQFKFIKTQFDGYYHIQSVFSGKNLDVNAHGTTAGVSIILWDMGTEDNQKFMVEYVPGGALIYSRNRNLPIEPYNTGIIQNTRTLSNNQKWEIIEFGTDYKKEEAILGEELVVTKIPEKPVTEEEKETYSIFTIGDKSLTDQGSLKMGENVVSDNTMWTLEEVTKDVYVITNRATGKSLDVNARSLEEGGSIITYTTNRDANQKWILEAQGDGTYMIKSVHSSLYLTVKDDGSLMQMGKNDNLSQKWTITVR
ncbi:MAG: RICIN domain-containing protein [Clostridia bacterium]